MSQQQPDPVDELSALKERIVHKLGYTNALIASAQEELSFSVNQVKGRSPFYCNHSLILRQEYGPHYDPGLDLVDILNSAP